MLVRKFLKKDPASAKEGKTVSEIKELMEEKNFRILFVVNDENQLIGFLTYDSIKNQNGEELIDNYLSRSTLHAEESDPIDKAVSIIKEYNLMVLPVVDSERKLVGVLTPGHLFEKLAELLNFGEGGFWITLPYADSRVLEEVLSVINRQGVKLLSLLKANNGDQRELIIKVGEVEEPERLKSALTEVV